MKTLIALAAAGVLFASPAFAKGKTVSISQHNQINGAVVGVIGNGSTVTVSQTGIVNAAVVVQLGSFSTAAVSQTGRWNVSAISQGN